MPALRIVLEGDGAFSDLQGKKIHHITEPFTVAALPGGMQSGATSVMFAIPLSDGSVVFAETSLKLLQMAAVAFTARYGDQT